ncbi:hypothetical protein AX15_000184 [Amanita polypyramis BW_CC]|nr:hypothetical protein AX15_000184 [Amanita polypyramis BW_CC]
MPRKKPSRLRRVSSDIDEEEVMENGTANARENDEVKTERVVKKGKEKAPERRKRAGGDESDEQDEDEEMADGSDDDDTRLDVSDFKDQPLGRGELQKLHGLATDWKDLDKKIKQNSGGVIQAALEIADIADGEEGEKSLKELDQLMRGLLDVSAEMNAHEETIDTIYQLVARGEAVNDALYRYQDTVKAKAREYTQKTSRQKYAKNEQYKKFKESIYEVLYPHLPMRPVTELIPREDGDDSDDEDDIEIGGVTQDYKCPMLLTPLTDPVTSKVCGHSYSAEGIRDYFRGQDLKNCPVAGCRQKIRKMDCVPDKELAQKVRIWLRRRKRAEEREDAEDAEEVVE